MSDLVKVEDKKTGMTIDGDEFAHLSKELKNELTILQKSGMFPDSKDTHKAVAKIMIGRGLGMGPAEALKGIILSQNGHATLTANTMAMRIKASGKYNYSFKFDEKGTCYTQAFEKVDGQWLPCGESSFGAADAKTAGLDTKETYKKYPKNLYFARAISNLAKWACPDVFGGTTPYLPDEVPNGVEIDGETLEPIVVEATPVKKVVKLPVAKKTTLLPEEYLTPLEELLIKAEVPETSWLNVYGVRDLNELTIEQAIDMTSKLKQKIALSPA